MFVSCNSEVTQDSCTGSLIVCVDEVATSKKATIRIDFKLTLRGFDTEQCVSLVYDGDNLASSVSMKGLEVKSGFDYIWRHQPAKPPLNARLMELNLRAPCAVLYPDSMVPKDGHEKRFNEVGTLAQATKVYILFDGAELQPEKDNQWKCLTTTEGLSRFEEPVDDRRDWKIFNVPPPYPGLNRH